MAKGASHQRAHCSDEGQQAEQLRQAQYTHLPSQSERRRADPEQEQRSSNNAVLNALGQEYGVNAVSFAAVFLDDRRQVHCHASPHLLSRMDDIIPPRSRQFLQVLSSIPRNAFQPDYPPETPSVIEPELATSTGRVDELATAESSARSSIASPSSQLHRVAARRKGSKVRFSGAKRKRTSATSSGAHSASDHEPEDDEEDADSVKLGHVQHSFALDDTDAIEAAYTRILEEIQQQSLKVILKKWIKVVEPRKQSNFPYCSSNQKPSRTTPEKGNKKKQKTHETAKIPPWWPGDVHHREPDHIRKPERIKLARGILGIRDPNRHCLMQELEEATNSIVGELKFRNEKPEKVNRRVKLLNALHYLAIQQCRVDNDERDATDFVTLSVLAEDSVPSRAGGHAKSRRSSVSISTDESSTNTEFSQMQDVQQPFHTDPSTTTFSQHPPAVAMQQEDTTSFFQGGRTGLADRLDSLSVTEAGASPVAYGMGHPHSTYAIEQPMLKTGSKDLLPHSPQHYMGQHPERIHYDFRPKSVNPIDYGFPPRELSPDDGTNRPTAFMSPIGPQNQFTSWQFPQPATEFSATGNPGVQNVATPGTTGNAMYPGQIGWANNAMAPASHMAVPETYPVSPTRGSAQMTGMETTFAQQGYTQPTVPDLAGARVQPHPQMLYPGAALRTGSLSHPHPGHSLPPHGMPNIYDHQDPRY